MITVTPQGNVYLCNVPLENDYNNQLTFTSLENQLNYFNSKIIKSFENYTYIKKDNVIKLGVNIDEIIGCNYLFYRNNGFTNKYYFCFITHKEYINENVTAVTIETDVYQSYMFDIQYKASFIEREHVNDDTVGLHTIPEGLETGEYISTNLQPQGLDSQSLFDYCYVVAVSDSEFVFKTMRIVFDNFKVPTGLEYYGLTDMLDVSKLVYAFDHAGKGDAIVSIFVSPKYFFSNWDNSGQITLYDDTVITLLGDISSHVTSFMQFDYNINRPSYLGNNYQPHNNKLLCYPYSFLQVSNHSGQIYNYNWENFYYSQNEENETRYRFRLKGALTPGGSFKAFPLNYNNILDNNDDTIALGKFPIGSFTNDIYTNWLTQNGVNILGHTIPADQVITGKATWNNLNTLTAVAEYGSKFGFEGDANSSVLTGGITSTLSNTFEATQEIYRHKIVPDNVNGNVNSGDVNFELNLYGLEFKTMSIKNEYAEIIDKYFDMFGYKVNNLKLPNITGRTNWNYVKTVWCELEGDIPQEHLTILKGIFNKGITFWHNPTTMLDYTQSNDII